MPALLGFVRRGFVIGAATVLAVATLAGPAGAKPLEQGRFHDSSSQVVTDFCGVADLDVVDAWDIYVNVVFNTRGPEGLAYFTGTNHGAHWWTNLATGRTMTVVFNEVDKDQKVTDNGDGTLTILIMGAGEYKVLGADGKILLRDPGQTWYEILVDNGGTPADPNDDEFLEFLGIVKGSTGLNEVEGHDFCEDFLAITS